MFRISDVSKKYNGEFVLNNISFTIAKGLNFIFGASGSGKTTLLKIISGLDQEFEGEVTYEGKPVKGLQPNEKSYLYNNVFGFVWQDFHLLEELTVLENVLLPTYLKSKQHVNQAKQLLKDLKLSGLSGKQVKYLSGGQKQRVAIARELMKKPKVIIADEPTSALDEETAKITMNILRTISQYTTVIVVTHDVSLFREKDHIYELDKGELIHAEHNHDNAAVIEPKDFVAPVMTLGQAFKMAVTHMKRNKGRFGVSVLTMLIASVLLLTTISGVVGNQSQNAFDDLFKTYGDSLLDIELYKGFTNSDGSGKSSGNSGGPDVTVDQNISGLSDKLNNDPRVEFTALLYPFRDIVINVDGQEHAVESSNSMPKFNKLLAGKMPANNAQEVAVPENFVQNLGLANEDIINKKITFSATIYNQNTGENVNVSTSVTVVGVIDTKVVYEKDGKPFDYSIKDSFFFDTATLQELRKQAGILDNNINFLIRPKTPADMISIKDELFKQGIVPSGRFTVVEDLLKLNKQANEQSGSAGRVVGMLAFVLLIALTLVTALLRKREYAICMTSGFINRHLNKVSFMEVWIEALCAILLLFVCSPLISMLTQSLFSVSLLSSRMLLTGVAIIIFMTAIVFGVKAIVYGTTKITATLKSGER